MTIARVIETRPAAEVYSCTADIPVREAIALLAAKRIGALPVVESGAVVGIFSERDVIYRLAEHGPAMLDKAVGEVMTAPVIAVDRDTQVLEALALMTRRRIRHLPVVADEALVGFVSIGDLVKHRMDRIESEAAAMRDYIQSA
jgi:CBS domain-containing protein